MKTTLQLQEPIMVSKKERTSLELRKPQLGDMLIVTKAIKDLPQDSQYSDLLGTQILISRCAGLLPEDIEGLSLEDFARAAEVVKSATPKGQESE